MRNAFSATVFLALTTVTAGCESVQDKPPIFVTRAEHNACMCWTPSKNEIDRFEKEVLARPLVAVVAGKALRSFPQPIESYRRIYAGRIVDLACIQVSADGGGGRPTPFSDDREPPAPCPPGLEPNRELFGLIIPVKPGGRPDVEVRMDGKLPDPEAEGCEIDGYPYRGDSVHCQSRIPAE